MKNNFYNKFLVDFENGVEDEDLKGFPELKMNYVPYFIGKIGTDILLTLNEDNVHFSNKEVPQHLTPKYTFGELFFDSNLKGKYKVLAWVKIESVKKLRKSLEYTKSLTTFA